MWLLRKEQSSDSAASRFRHTLLIHHYFYVSIKLCTLAVEHTPFSLQMQLSIQISRDSFCQQLFDQEEERNQSHFIFHDSKRMLLLTERKTPLVSPCLACTVSHSFTGSLSYTETSNYGAVTCETELPPAPLWQSLIPRGEAESLGKVHQDRAASSWTNLYSRTWMVLMQRSISCDSSRKSTWCF